MVPVIKEAEISNHLKFKLLILSAIFLKTLSSFENNEKFLKLFIN